MHDATRRFAIKIKPTLRLINVLPALLTVNVCSDHTRLYDAGPLSQHVKIQLSRSREYNNCPISVSHLSTLIYTHTQQTHKRARALERRGTAEP